MKYYLVGIKGSGMSALATYLKTKGHEVIGSDTLQNYGFEQNLISYNIKVFPFSKENIKPEYIYVISNAYKDDFEEVREIKKNNYTHFYYHEFISKINSFQIAISGTHGKTTTATFIKDLLIDEDISYIIGDGSGYGSVNDKYLIYEACEYQDHFLAYHPDILVITNIDYDHPDYFNDLSQVTASFNKLKKQSKMVIELEQDDFEILKVSSRNTKLKYLGNIYEVNLVGTHLIKDLVLAFKVLTHLGYNHEYISQRLNNIKMPKRRMEEKYLKNTIIVEDYGHHPKEIKALYDALKTKYPTYFMTCIFQPHTYSRTFTFYKEFIKSLSLFDQVFIDEVFTSKREPYSTEKQNNVNYLFKMFDSYCNFDFNQINFDNFQIIVLLGAGDVNKRFLEKLKNEKE